MWTILNTPWIRNTLLAAVVAAAAFYSGDRHRANIDKQATLASIVVVEKNNTIKLEKASAQFNQILAVQSESIVLLTKRTTILLQRIKENEKTINADNRINDKWVFYASSLNSLSESTESAINQNTAIPNASTIPSRVLEYVVKLHDYADTCNLNRNALIDAVNVTQGD